MKIANKKQMLKWTMLSFVGLGILTACNKEELTREQDVAQVEQKNPTHFKVHFEGEVLDLYVENIDDYDYTYKELKHPKLTQLAAAHSINTVEGIPGEDGKMSNDLYVFRNIEQANDCHERFMEEISTKQTGLANACAYRYYEKTWYTGNSRLVYYLGTDAHNLIGRVVPDLASGISRSKSCEDLGYTAGNVFNIYYLKRLSTNDAINGKYWLNGRPSIGNMPGLNIDKHKYLSGSSYASGTFNSYW